MLGKDIVCIAPNSWSDLWRRRHQLISRFARRNRVLYIEPPRSLLTPFYERQILGSSLRFQFGLRQEIPGLHVYSPLNLLPLARVSFFDRINGALVSAGIKRTVRQLGICSPILWLYYTSKTALIADAIRAVTKPRLTCYDCYDNYAGYQGVTGVMKSRILTEELELIQMADVVFVVSERLYREKACLNPRTFLMPNGVDIEADTAAKIMPTDMKSIPHPIIGFTGQISSNKIDLRLIQFMLESRPYWSVVLVGPTFPDMLRIIASWPRYRNLYLLGKKEPWELPAYLESFDVCIAPYLDNQQLLYSSPLKVYEYLAVGKPAVVTGFAPAPFLNGLMRTAATPEKFVSQVEESLQENDEELVRQRIETARQNSWDRRMEQIENILAPLLRTGLHVS